MKPFITIKSCEGQTDAKIFFYDLHKIGRDVKYLSWAHWFPLARLRLELGILLLSHVSYENPRFQTVLLLLTKKQRKDSRVFCASSNSDPHRLLWLFILQCSVLNLPGERISTGQEHF